MHSAWLTFIVYAEGKGKTALGLCKRGRERFIKMKIFEVEKYMGFQSKGQEGRWKPQGNNNMFIAQSKNVKSAVNWAHGLKGLE